MESDAYLRALNTQLTYLFAFTRKINELDTAAALNGEFRGMQDAGWSTVVTAHEVFGEMKTLATKGAPLTRPELRQLLSLYAQLAEAGGVYETLLNTMRVVQLKVYNMWPFQDLVRVRQIPPAVIGPNSNAMFRELASVAIAIGMPSLARLLEITFRDDIRNGVAHADYILGPNGLRLRRRNGGQPILVSIEQIQTALQIALFFFELLHDIQRDVLESFRPARTIIGRLSANPPMPWTVELSEDGGFSLSSRAAGQQVDAAYQRQERINNHLGGRVVAAYVAVADDFPQALLAEIAALGLDVLVVDFETTEQLDALMREVEVHGLWDHAPVAAAEGIVMATPMGFRRITTGAEFQAWLPAVQELRIE